MATLKEIAAAIKKLGSADKLPAVPAVARQLDEPVTGGFVGQVYLAEPVAFPELQIKGTQAAVKAARMEGLRFERIAARSGLTVGEVRDLADKAGVGADFYTGRGRKPNGNGNSASPKATSGRRSTKKEEPKATSGRRGRAKAAEAESTDKPKPRGRRGTRAAAAK